MNIINWFDSNVSTLISESITVNMINELYNQIWKRYEKIDEKGNRIVTLNKILELEGRLGTISLPVTFNGELTKMRPSIPPSPELSNSGLCQLTSRIYNGKSTFDSNIGPHPLYVKIRNWIELHLYQPKLIFYNHLVQGKQLVQCDITEVKQWINTCDTGRLQEVTDSSRNKTWSVITKTYLKIGYDKQRNIDIITKVPIFTDIEKKVGLEFRIALKDEYEISQNSNQVKSWEVNEISSNINPKKDKNNNNNSNKGDDNNNNNTGTTIILNRNSNNSNNSNSNTKKPKDKLSNSKNRLEQNEVLKIFSEDHIMSQTCIGLRYKSEHRRYKVGAWGIDISPITVYVDILPSEFVDSPEKSITTKHDKKGKLDEVTEFEVELNLKELLEKSNKDDIIISPHTCNLLSRELLTILMGFTIIIGDLYQNKTNNDDDNDDTNNNNNNNNNKRKNKERDNNNSNKKTKS
jgi:hypothetical protein